MTDNVREYILNEEWEARRYNAKSLVDDMEKKLRKADRQIDKNKEAQFLLNTTSNEVAITSEDFFLLYDKGQLLRMLAIEEKNLTKWRDDLKAGITDMKKAYDL